MRGPVTRVRIQARGVGVDLGGHPVLRDVDLDVRAGELLALVGPNGAGKSTLLNALSGDLAPRHGTVTIDGRPVATTRPGDLARERAVLPQENRLAFGFRVVDVVRMGRAAWAGRPEEDRDDEVVADALVRTDVLHLAERSFPTLSGGERARASLARVLAQTTAVVLLDEPTAALDVRHVEVVMAQARALAAAGHAVVAVLHDLSVAAAHADRVCVLAAGRVQAVGTPAEVLRPDLLSVVYGHPVDVIEHGGRLLVVPHRLDPAVQAEEVPCSPASS